MSIKLTKNEEKKQKDSLSQYKRYLPTLQLKKKQLQSVIREYKEKCDETVKRMEDLRGSLKTWVSLFSENRHFENSISNYVKAKNVLCSKVNVAGIEIPCFESVEFEDLKWDISVYPLWVDTAISTLKDYVSLEALSSVYKEAVRLLENELKTCTQRVNLFEKVKIPETQENIRKIQVALQDQQTASVVKGKIAKKKLS